uniref:Uncharacterized protein n=1 Tax=Oryza glumipatula TaxID=40148 RepID=A0A0D9ZKZ1_9ORYZ
MQMRLWRRVHRPDTRLHPRLHPLSQAEERSSFLAFLSGQAVEGILHLGSLAEILEQATKQTEVA